jgi:hypothetical protein
MLSHSLNFDSFKGKVIKTYKVARPSLRQAQPVAICGD